MRDREVLHIEEKERRVQVTEHLLDYDNNEWHVCSECTGS